MEMYKVESSFIDSIGYDPTMLNLWVSTYSDLDNRIRTYQYHGVPITRYASFWTADSKGAYYNRFIRGKYDVDLIDLESDTVQNTEGITLITAKDLASALIDEAIDRLKSWV